MELCEASPALHDATKPGLNNPIGIYFSKKVITQDVPADLGFEHFHPQSSAALIAQVAGLSIFLTSL